MVSRIAMGVAGLAIALALVACGDDDEVSPEELQQATKQAAQEARKEVRNEQRLERLRDRVKELTKAADPKEGGDRATTTTTTETTASPSGGGGLPADAQSCGGGVYARSGTTSCPFALNVAADYFENGGGSFTSYSPTTGQRYTMSCSGGAPVICTGGNNAAVYIP